MEEKVKCPSCNTEINWIDCMEVRKWKMYEDKMYELIEVEFTWSCPVCNKTIAFNEEDIIRVIWQEQ
jgi:endogenous inhibitor of DNA gyrase (YacG/DUF329 family)